MRRHTVDTVSVDTGPPMQHVADGAREKDGSGNAHRGRPIERRGNGRFRIGDCGHRDIVTQFGLPIDDMPRELGFRNRAG